MDARQAILHGDEMPDVWTRAPERRRALVDEVGEEAVRRAERAVTLFQIDRAWRDHLALAADLREGIHLVGLGGQDPLTRFTTEITVAFRGMEDAIDGRGARRARQIRVSDGRVDLERLGIKGPSSTWTYLVNDDPFRNQIGMMLTGPGRATIAIYAAAIMMPLLLLWGLVDRDPAKASQAEGESISINPAAGSALPAWLIEVASVHCASLTRFSRSARPRGERR